MLSPRGRSRGSRAPPGNASWDQRPSPSRFGSAVFVTVFCTVHAVPYALHDCIRHYKRLKCDATNIIRKNMLWQNAEVLSVHPAVCNMITCMALVS